MLAIGDIARWSSKLLDEDELQSTVWRSLVSTDVSSTEPTWLSENPAITVNHIATGLKAATRLESVTATNGPGSSGTLVKDVDGTVNAGTLEAARGDSALTHDRMARHDGVSEVGGAVSTNLVSAVGHKPSIVPNTHDTVAANARGGAKTVVESRGMADEGLVGAEETGRVVLSRMDLVIPTNGNVVSSGSTTPLMLTRCLSATKHISYNISYYNI